MPSQTFNPNPAECPDLIDGADAAGRFLAMSPGTVRQLADKGRLPHRRVGNRYKFSRTRLEEWLRGTDDGTFTQN